MTNLTNLIDKRNTPFETRMSIARTALVEPQKLHYRKTVEPTPFELAMEQQRNDGRNEWDTYDDKMDFVDKCGNVEEWD